MRRTLLLAALLCVVNAPAATAQAACDRGCLRGILTQYLDALVAHAPGTLPAAPRLKFTEDNVQKTPGDGLWKSITRLRPYRLEFIDDKTGVAGAHIVVDEGARPAMVAVRLKVADRKITEAETMIVRGREEGVFFNIDALDAVSPAMLVRPTPTQRHSREEAIRIASLYAAGLRAGSFVKADVPFAPDAYRLENGQMLAGPSCTFLPGCHDIKGQRFPMLSETRYRLVAVDEEMGIVWFRLDFGAGSIQQSTTTKLIVWEAFKVYGGQIHAVEAFMETAPMASGSGWEPEIARELVGTWTLTSLEEAVDSAQPARVAQARGVLIVDAAGHVIETVSRPRQQAPAGQPPLTDAQMQFGAFAGLWGRYTIDAASQRLTYTPSGAVHPNLPGKTLARTFQLAGDTVTITSSAGEPHTRGVTRWVWEKVPPVADRGPTHRQVAGFWEHVVEHRINLTAGTSTEQRRAPSVIVYSPAGYVAVLFPPQNRQPFAGDIPTDAEARAAVQGYVGYYGALAVYPTQVFHHIMANVGVAAGNVSSGNTLKRGFELKGDEVRIIFPVTRNQQGQETTTTVTLKRLSGDAAMIPQ
jgi:hypothetical protein